MGKSFLEITGPGRDNPHNKGILPETGGPGTSKIIPAGMIQKAAPGGWPYPVHERHCL